MRCGIWDVLMLLRPARVHVPLPAHTSGAALAALPGEKPLADLRSQGTLQDSVTEALVHCTQGDEFKCGFASAEGLMEVDFGLGMPRYTRRSAIDMRLPYAHGLPLAVFNAPVLYYFEVETHSPLRTLGTRVRELILVSITTVKFFAPDVAYADARKHLPPLLIKRGVDASAVLVVLERLETIVQSMDAELCQGMRRQALQRIALRDADDWPVLACAMALGCPV